MQAIELVKTIKWIDSFVTPAMKEYVFSPRLLSNPNNDRGDLKASALQASHDWARVLSVWNSDQKAVEVLSAFGVSALLDEKSPILFAESLFREEATGRLHNNYVEIALPYNRMIEICSPLEQLLIPPALRELTQSDDILSITIHENEDVALKLLQHALEHLQSIYATLSEIDGIQPLPLKIVSIQSGSPIGVNLKGSGDIIKQFRLLMGDVWNRLRYKNQDEQIANNNVLMSSLKVMGDIQKRVDNGTLTPEEGEKFKRSITRGTLGLLNCHTLPTEIESVELVPNNLLLNSFNPKLLEASTPKMEDLPNGAKGGSQNKPRRTRSRKPRNQPVE